MSDIPLRISQTGPSTTNIDGIPGTTSPDIIGDLAATISELIETNFPIVSLDMSGLSTAVTEIITSTPLGDYGPPAQPSIPILTPIPSGIEAAWDGVNADGSTTRTPDWDHIDVHMSTTPSFTPSSLTVVASIIATSAQVTGTVSQGGSVVIPDSNYGVLQYVRFVAVGRSGQQSPPSGQSSAEPLQITNLDVKALSLEVTKFKNLNHYLY